MRVVCDSSGCCGIKIIRDFYQSPDCPLYLAANDGHDEDTYTSEPDAYSNWAQVPSSWNQGRTCAEVFKSYVTQIMGRRPSGMIVVNLVASYETDEEAASYGRFDEDSVDEWRPYLIKEGFTEQTFINSNSDGRIHRFTLIYGDN